MFIGLDQSTLDQLHEAKQYRKWLESDDIEDWDTIKSIAKEMSRELRRFRNGNAALADAREYFAGELGHIEAGRTEIKFALREIRAAREEIKIARDEIEAGREAIEAEREAVRALQEFVDKEREGLMAQQAVFQRQQEAFAAKQETVVREHDEVVLT